MALPLTLKDLDPRDVGVLWDLIRFGELADYQIDRRYGSPEVTLARLGPLLNEGIVKPSDKRLQGVTTLYEATTKGFFLARFGLKHHKVHELHTAHDIALVDLADYFRDAYPTATYKAESEVGREFYRVLNGRRFNQDSFNRSPDGLLIWDGKQIGIELEHSIKSEDLYRKICGWYAVELRLDQIWWFTDDPAIEARLRKVNTQFGYENDIQVRYEPFPPGVVVRRRGK